MRIAFGALALCLAATATHAAEPKPPEGFLAARKALADTVEKKNVKAFAALSRFPLTIDVYQMAPKITKKRFDDGDINMMFGGGDEGMLKCLRGDSAQKNDPKADETAKRFGASWYADCDGNNYYFAEKGGTWSFIGYQNVNE